MAGRLDLVSLAMCAGQGVIGPWFSPDSNRDCARFERAVSAVGLENRCAVTLAREIV